MKNTVDLQCYYNAITMLFNMVAFYKSSYLGYNIFIQVLLMYFYFIVSRDRHSRDCMVYVDLLYGICRYISPLNCEFKNRQ